LKTSTASWAFHGQLPDPRKNGTRNSKRATISVQGKRRVAGVLGEAVTRGGTRPPHPKAGGPQIGSHDGRALAALRVRGIGAALSVPLEVLNIPFVLLRTLARFERAKISDVGLG
jgi:hypothetical protein